MCVSSLLSRNTTTITNFVELLTAVIIISIYAVPGFLLNALCVNSFNLYEPINAVGVINTIILQVQKTEPEKNGAICPLLHS